MATNRSEWCVKCGFHVPGDATQCAECGTQVSQVTTSRSSAQAGGASPIVVGVLIGALLGYPLSYYFQPGALRAKHSLGKYIAHFSEIIGESELQSAIFIGFLVAMGAGAGIGWLVQNARRSAK